MNVRLNDMFGIKLNFMIDKLVNLFLLICLSTFDKCDVIQIFFPFLNNNVMMRTQCPFHIGNCDFPCEVLHRSFIKLNCIILGSGKQVLLVCFSGIFCDLCKYIHNDVVKHNSTGHKTQWFVITYVILFDWGKCNKMNSV